MSNLRVNNQPSAIRSNASQMQSRNDQHMYTSISGKPVHVNVNPPRLTSKFSYGSTIQRQSSFNTQLNDVHFNPSSKKFSSEWDSFLPQERQNSARLTNKQIKNQSEPKKVFTPQQKEQEQDISSKGCKNCQIM